MTDEETKEDPQEEVEEADDNADLRIKIEKLEEDALEAQRLIKKQDRKIDRQNLAGRSVGQQQAEKKIPMTDEEVGNAVLEGKINPLKEDGFI